MTANLLKGDSTWRKEDGFNKQLTLAPLIRVDSTWTHSSCRLYSIVHRHCRARLHVHIDLCTYITRLVFRKTLISQFFINPKLCNFYKELIKFFEKTGFWQNWYYVHPLWALTSINQTSSVEKSNSRRVNDYLVVRFQCVL